MALDLLGFAVGLVVLVGGAEALIRGATRLALSLGLPPLVVGLTIVAFGTSAPELTVSIGAVLKGQTGLALGNVVGSNIFNVLGVLGLAALVTPLAVERQLIRQEVPVMIGAAVLVLLLSQDGTLGWIDGALLTTLMIGYTTFLVRQARGGGGSAVAPVSSESSPEPSGGATSSGRLRATLWLVAGLAGLALGADTMVQAAVSIARHVGLDEVVIGLTVVAVGTSLPEVASTVVAAARGQRDLAVGNVVGSCLFNLLGVLGPAALFAGRAGLEVPPAVQHFDLWVMLAALAACLPIFFTGREIARWEGALFLLYYAAYTAYLLLRAQAHDALPAYSSVMIGFFVPMTVVTLVVAVSRRAAD
ncbi:MAG: calcium/sodium antiporter [Rubrivivax sp.]